MLSNLLVRSISVVLCPIDCKIRSLNCSILILSTSQNKVPQFSLFWEGLLLSDSQLGAFSKEIREGVRSLSTALQGLKFTYDEIKEMSLCHHKQSPCGFPKLQSSLCFPRIASSHELIESCIIFGMRFSVSWWFMGTCKGSLKSSNYLLLLQKNKNKNKSTPRNRCSSRKWVF